MNTPFDFAVVGGGIVGLSVAYHLQRWLPGRTVVVLEKEPMLAAHQTGRNSGVIHSGIYYKPGSFKARFAREGGAQLVAFCREQGVPFDLCGKVIVASTDAELPRLRALFERGRQHGLQVEMLTPDAVREIEPHVCCRAGIRVPETGIVSYRHVCARLAGLVESAGGEIRLRTEVKAATWAGDRHVLQTGVGELSARFLVNCAGLHCDRVAAATGGFSPARIVPFRGEYYELTSARSSLVRTLIYPVPDPAFPFLGVHFTRMIDGSVHAGPNAVLALKREGYVRSDCNLRDMWDTLTYAGFWRLAGRHYRDALREVHRSFSKPEFVRSLQRLIPEVGEDDLVPGAAGVRAQALLPDGGLVDDFLLAPAERAMHVLNAPSPAATASLAIGAHVARELVGSGSGPAG